jgi:DNA sulfur modification protein DndB
MNKESVSLEFFGPLLTDPSKIKREAVRRRKQSDEKSISAAEIPEYEADGWHTDRRLKHSIRVKRPKAIDERLENRFWMLLARLGYPEINAGRKFTMLIDRKGAEPLRKQVDVFAKDEETVIVAECKACANFSRRSLQKDIEEFANLKKPIASAIKRHYGDEKKLKIIVPAASRFGSSLSASFVTTRRLLNTSERRLGISFWPNFLKIRSFLN